MRRLFILILLIGCQLTAWAAADTGKPALLSFVALSQPRLPSAENLKATLQVRLGHRLQVGQVDANDKAIVLAVPGGRLMVGLIEAPLPKGTVDDLCKSAWFWREACKALEGHTAHAVVSVMGTTLDKLDTALLLTDLVVALMAQDNNVIASYWGASLQPRDAFIKLAEGASRELPPVWLWINFRLSGDAQKRWSLSTQGMRDFGLHEIETQNAAINGGELFGLLMGMAQYLVHKGPVIKDGDTIGDSPEQKARVRIAPSYWREGATVYRVLFAALP